MVQINVTNGLAGKGKDVARHHVAGGDFLRPMILEVDEVMLVSHRDP